MARDPVTGVARHLIAAPMVAKPSIFISSVQKDLADERRALKDFVQGDPLLRHVL